MPDTLSDYGEWESPTVQQSVLPSMGEKSGLLRIPYESEDLDLTEEVRSPSTWTPPVSFEFFAVDMAMTLVVQSEACSSATARVPWSAVR